MKTLSLAGILLLFCSISWAAENTGPEAIVYKDPNCGCCSSWVAYLRDNNFTVTEVNVDDISMYKSKYNVPANVSACHTAIVQDYVIEGHVPVEDILRLLQEKTDITGLAVPGMPLGAPGMEAGGRSQAYDVIAINKDGSTSTYNSYEEK